MYVVNKVIKELALFLEGTSEMDSESLSEELDRIPIIRPMHNSDFNGFYSCFTGSGQFRAMQAPFASLQ